MTLQSLTIKEGASAMTPTGGSDETFTPDGVSVQNGIHLAEAAETDFRIRPNLTVKYRQPSLSPTGVYSKDKKSMVYVRPKILADGSTVFNLVRLEREVHPESTAAEALELNMAAAQLLTDSDVSNFWASGSMA